jgi:hypothetical protein
MLIVAVSRGLVVPFYLAQLEIVDLSQPVMEWLPTLSFACLLLALGVGGFIIVGAMLRGHRAATRQDRNKPIEIK